MLVNRQTGTCLSGNLSKHLLIVEKQSPLKIGTCIFPCKMHPRYLHYRQYRTQLFAYLVCTYWPNQFIDLYNLDTEAVIKTASIRGNVQLYLGEQVTASMLLNSAKSGSYRYRPC